MTTLLLAQAEPADPTVTPTTIGIVVIAIIYLSRWLWDYNRARREDAEQHEPRADPPLHRTYATKEELDRIKAAAEAEDHQLHGRISGVRNELNAKIDGIEGRIDAIPQRTIELLNTTKALHQK